MLKDVKKMTDLEEAFQKNPLAVIDYAYEAVVDKIKISEEYKEAFDKATEVLMKVPAGEIVKKVDMFLELDIFSTDFSVLDGLKVWQVIQFYSDEAVKQARFAQ